MKCGCKQFVARILTSHWGSASPDAQSAQLSTGFSRSTGGAITDEKGLFRSSGIEVFLVVAERDTLEVDVLFVGAGPASLSGALCLQKLIAAHNQETAKPEEKLGPVSIAILEKGREVGAHSLSGAILDPVALEELLPEVSPAEIPSAVPVTQDSLVLLSTERKFSFPWVPSPLKNRGNYIVSLNRLVKWLGERVERSGIEVLAGFAGAGLLFEGDRLAGVRTGEQGLDRLGLRKPVYEQGVDILAKVTVLGEGVHGSLTRQLSLKLSLDRDRNPAVYALGLKELWEVPENSAARGRVIHTLGYPLGLENYGGGFLYHAGKTVSVGLVVGLDYHNPYLDPHQEFQLFKTHPFVASILKGGKLLHWGAKALPEGGYHSIPKTSFPGGLIVGDSAGLLDSLRLKGIHLAMKSGMLAAETIFQALLQNDFSESTLSYYEKRLLESWVGQKLSQARNYRQGFQRGLVPGLLQVGLQKLTGGRVWPQRLPASPSHLRMETLADYRSGTVPLPALLSTDGGMKSSKETSVYFSGIRHEEDQPSHLLITDPNLCLSRCAEEYGNPCQRFCPAGVFEMVDSGEGRGLRLQVNSSNCVHCMTCDIVDPYQIIRWTPPEGGSGPNYLNL